MFYASIVFVSLALIDKLLVSPALIKAESLEKAIATQRTVIQEDLRFVALEKGINMEASHYAGYFSKDVSSDEEMNEFLKLIESFAHRSTINIVNIRPAGLKTDKNVVKYYVDLNCRGEMDKMVDFLYSIESANKILAIEKLVLTPQEEGSSSAQCRITVSKVSIN